MSLLYSNHAKNRIQQWGIRNLDVELVSNHHFPPSAYPMTPRPTNALINTSTES